MSKMTVLNDAIEKLEAAETALCNARQAFVKDSTEWNMLDTQFEVAGDAVGIVQEVMRRAEKEIIQLKTADLQGSGGIRVASHQQE